MREDKVQKKSIVVPDFNKKNHDLYNFIAEVALRKEKRYQEILLRMREDYGFQLCRTKLPCVDLSFEAHLCHWGSSEFQQQVIDIPKMYRQLLRKTILDKQIEGVNEVEYARMYGKWGCRRSLKIYFRFSLPRGEDAILQFVDQIYISIMRVFAAVKKPISFISDMSGSLKIYRKECQYLEWNGHLKGKMKKQVTKVSSEKQLQPFSKHSTFQHMKIKIDRPKV